MSPRMRQTCPLARPRATVKCGQEASCTAMAITGDSGSFAAAGKALTARSSAGAGPSHGSSRFHSCPCMSHFQIQAPGLATSHI